MLTLSAATLTPLIGNLGTDPEVTFVLLALATDDVVARALRADEIVKTASKVVGGGGGGRPGLAQAGGRDPGRLDAALDVARRAARDRPSRRTPSRCDTSRYTSARSLSGGD